MQPGLIFGKFSVEECPTFLMGIRGHHWEGSRGPEIELWSCWCAQTKHAACAEWSLLNLWGFKGLPEIYRRFGHKFTLWCTKKLREEMVNVKKTLQWWKALQCVLIKKVIVCVGIHTYSMSAIKSVTPCIDKLHSESDCHTRPFNPPSDWV